MSIVGLGTFQSKANYYAMFRGNKEMGIGSFGSALAQDEKKYGIKDDTNTTTELYNESTAQKELDATCIPVASKRYGEPAAYNRCITANVRTQEMIAQQNEDGEVIFSYKETTQSFNILINSDGKDKTYTIKGIDENGEEFERVFNPYDLDPKDMDYPEFSALCLYIKQTDETADLIASSYFTDTSYFDGIFDRGDRVSLLDQYAKENNCTEPSLAYLANTIFDAINSFFDRVLRSSRINEEAFPLLFADLDDIATQERIEALKNGNNSLEDAESVITDTTVSRHTEYTDPETGEIVPVDIKYITLYSDEGVSCKEIISDGDKDSERQLWSIQYDSPDSYEKIQGFLRSFSQDKKLTFATQESFWKDFMKDDFDTDSFRAYYDSTDNGIIDFDKAKADGKSLRDTLTEPYAEYINNNHFAGHVYSEDDLQPSWYKNGQIRFDVVYDPSVPTETSSTSSFVSRVFTEEELFQYVDDRVKSNQGKKKSLFDMLKDSSPEGTSAMFRFAGESKTYDFFDFIDEFERRSKKERA